jgi:hypothetical protein
MTRDEVQQLARERGYDLIRDNINGDVGYTFQSLDTGCLHGHFATLDYAAMLLRTLPAVPKFNVRVTYAGGGTLELPVWAKTAADALIKAIGVRRSLGIAKVELI